MSLSAVVDVYKPYFRGRNSLWQWFLVALLIIGNITQAILIVLINVCFNQFFGILIAPTFTLPALLWSISYYLLAVGGYTITAGINSFAGDKLIYHLNLVVTENYLARWIGSKTYFGANFLSKRKVVSPAGILSYDIQETNRLTVKLGDNLINTFFAFIAGLYGLWQLSSPLTFEIASLLFVIPGYMAIGALIYAITYNLIVSKIGARLKRTTEKQYRIINRLEAHIHHIEKNAEGIELLRAQEQEKSYFVRILQKNNALYAVISRLQFGLVSFSALNEHLRFFVGILLSIPQLIIEKMSIDHLLTIGDYFTRVASFFTWRHDNYEDATNLEVYVDKLNALRSEMTEWESIRGQSKLKFIRGKQLALIDLLIHKPDKTLLLSQKHFCFKNHTVTLVQGPSGIGKSVLFGVLSGIWPYVKGTISLPVENDELHIIPQRPIFPLRSTLYAAILYQNNNEITQAKKQKIETLLRKFQIGESSIRQVDEKRDWSQILSAGEQHRIALIRAILAKPKLLLMDEPYSGMDSTLCRLCERILKKELPTTTIVYIDHRSSVKSCKKNAHHIDEVVFEKARLTRKKRL